MPIPYSVFPLKRLAGMVKKNAAGVQPAALLRSWTLGRTRPQLDFGVGVGSGVFVLQPPLPLQEFWPLQPLSPALQPPCPLQEFWPLQSCLPVSAGAVPPLPDCPAAYARVAMDPA